MTRNNISKEEKAAVAKIMGRKSPKGYAKKGTSDTFWNKLRVTNGYTLKELADVLEVDISHLSMYLTGKMMPRYSFIGKIADLFGVGHEEAEAQFKIGYDIWHNTHGKSVKVNPKKNNPIIEDKIKEYIPKTEEAKVDDTCNKGITVDDILKALHPILDYQQFTSVVIALYNTGNVNWEPVLDIAYQKVDREMYEQLLAMAKRV